MKKRKFLNNKNLIIVSTIIILIFILFLINFLPKNSEYGLKEFNDCLANKGITIYGSEWCPACNELVQKLGGHEKVNMIYVECTEERERCENETKTNYVPEIQINNEVYEGPRTIENLAEITGCKIP